MCVGAQSLGRTLEKGFSHNPVTQREILCCTPTRVGCLLSRYVCLSIFETYRANHTRSSHLFFFFFVLSYSVWINIIIIWIEKQISNLDKIFLTLFEERRRTNKIQSGDIFFFDSRQMGKLVRSKVFVCLFLPRLFAIYTKQFP